MSAARRQRRPSTYVRAALKLAAESGGVISTGQVAYHVHRAPVRLPTSAVFLALAADPRFEIVDEWEQGKPIRGLTQFRVRGVA